MTMAKAPSLAAAEQHRLRHILSISLQLRRGLLVPAAFLHPRQRSQQPDPAKEMQMLQFLHRSLSLS